MKVYQTNDEGFFIGATVADQDPLDLTNWLIPGGCVTEAPPALLDGQRAQFLNGAWGIVEPPAVEEPRAPDEPVPLTRKMQEALRRFDYVQEADPLFFMAQRGEATMEEWVAKVAEIKARYPYPGA